VTTEEVMAELKKQDEARAARPKTKLVPCALPTCDWKATVSVDWPKGQPAYCSTQHREWDMVDKALVAEGRKLHHLVSCPGCAGTGVDVGGVRFGGEEALCEWYEKEGKWYRPSWDRPNDVLASLVKACARIEIQTAVGPEAIDEELKQAFSEPCNIPQPLGWRCTRNRHDDGDSPCAAIPIPGVENPHMDPSSSEPHLGNLLVNFFGVGLIAVGSFIGGCAAAWYFLG
jgi:hypothetical protein